MSRQFLTDNADATSGHSEVRSASATEEKIAVTPERVLNDALAGSLPEWDLLPASPFVRRVK
jgi:hypothetical protein